MVEDSRIERLRGFKKRMDWFLNYRADLHETITHCELCPGSFNRMLALPTRERLERVLRYMLDENEFLSPYGLRSLSRFHHDHPYTLHAPDQDYRVDYAPAEAHSHLFGGNSNWRGPIWFPINFLIVEALERYHHFYGDQLRVECPTGSGNMMNLQQVAQELARRLEQVFFCRTNTAPGRVTAMWRSNASDPNWRDLVLFYEYFHGETGRGCGASHQTGWTALATNLLDVSMCPGDDVD